MRPLKYILIFVLFFALFGCEEVIQVDLNSANPAIVIEAGVSNHRSLHSGNYEVRITKSTDFYEPGIYPTVEDATVNIEDGEGNIYNFNYGEDGYYFSDSLLIGISEKTYTINVNAEGKQYQASSTMPNPIEIDSIYYERRPIFSGKKIILAHIIFQDDPNEENFARIKVSINDSSLANFGIYTDRLSNGNMYDAALFVGIENEDIKFGDIIKVEVQAIDKAGFEYFKTLRRVQANNDSGGGQVAPANPVTNWNNDALGYFSAMAVTTRSIVLGF